MFKNKLSDKDKTFFRLELINLNEKVNSKIFGKYYVKEIKLIKANRINDLTKNYVKIIMGIIRFFPRKIQ